MTRAELIAQLIEEVNISALSNPQDFENASDAASRETGWAFEVSGNFKIHWIMERAKRHLFFYLLSQSAHKFKVKQISLDKRFDHYFKVVKYMDEQFAEIQKDSPEEFANVSSYKLFGTVVNAGFASDALGRDITYDDDQLVILSPDEG